MKIDYLVWHRKTLFVKIYPGSIECVISAQLIAPAHAAIGDSNTRVLSFVSIYMYKSVLQNAHLWRYFMAWF